MDLTEQKSDFDVLALITEKLSEKYEGKAVGQRQCYVNKNAVLFHTFRLQNEHAFGIEYADTVTDAEQGRFEDGDIFYLVDYNTWEEMFFAMCQEIDSTVAESQNKK